MDLRKLKTILDLFENSTASELEILEGDDRVRLVKNAPPPVAVPVAGVPQQVVAVAPPPSPQPAAAPPEAGAQEASGAPAEGAEEPGEVVRAPMVGTFYRASSPEGEPFVKVGDRVEEGQTICIIEAMKLMNEVSAPCEGEVRKILVENASPVGFDDALIVIG